MSKRLAIYLAPYRLWVFLGIVLLILAKGVEVYIPMLMGDLVQVIIGQSINLEGNTALFFEVVVNNALVVLSLLLVSYALELITVWIRAWVGQKIVYRLRTEVYEAILCLEQSYYDHQSVGKLVGRVIHDVSSLSRLFTESVIPIFTSFLLIIGIFLGILVIDWRVALALFLFTPLIVGFLLFFKKRQRESYRIVRKVVADLNGFMQEELMGIHTVRDFSLEEYERAQFERINELHRKENVRVWRIRAAFLAGIEWFQALVVLFTFAVLIYLGNDSTGFQIGTYFTVSLYALMFFRPVRELAEQYESLQQASAGAERVFEILDLKPEESSTEGKLHLNSVQKIEFQDVWFTYKPGQWVLKGISFSIDSQEKVALVGLTGEGKSTIMHLILRLYEIQQGSILINGVDIREYDLKSLRSQFAVVNQNPALFSGTILENITFGKEHLTLGEAREILESMEFTLDPYMEVKERGEGLSYGERQLVAIARSIAHGAHVFLLDEPTSSVDTFTEQQVQKAMDKLIMGRTSLVIAHRLSTVCHSDRILVIHGGRIAEEGSHDFLLKKQGIYEKLYRLYLSGDSDLELYS